MAEGLIISICVTFAGISIIIYHLLIKVRNLPEYTLTIYFNFRSFIKLSYLALFGITFIIIRFIEDIYKNKGWYNPRFWPPDDYVQGYKI
jgi:hypothetical protein